MTDHDPTTPQPILAPALQALSPTISHGFFTREGGVSEGLYAGLNVGLGSSDERPRVEENRRRVAAWFGLPVERLATQHQVHSPDVVTLLDADDLPRRQADAMVTAVPGLILGVLSADCGPILFADPEARVVGAAHAGWKGALDGVLEATVDSMETLGAKRENIVAVLGPSIAQPDYEVGPEFEARFVAQDPAYVRYFTPSGREGHFLFDLPALTIDRLQAMGVQASSLGLSTYPDEKLFYSYRRTTHRREPDYGRQISAIAIQEK